jgi:AraC-like DNA-binding protein
MIPPYVSISSLKPWGTAPRQLGRLLKKETGLSPVAFILELRLQRAYQLLQERTFFTVSEVRYEVGIESASYFSSKFQARYGIPPSDLLKAEV